MKKQSIVIQINSYAELDKQYIIDILDAQLPLGCFVSAIKNIGINERNIIEYSALNRKKNIHIKHDIVNLGYAYIEFTYLTY